jgi:hypothetical protein
MHLRSCCQLGGTLNAAADPLRSHGWTVLWLAGFMPTPRHRARRSCCRRRRRRRRRRWRLHRRQLHCHQAGSLQTLVWRVKGLQAGSWPPGCWRSAWTCWRSRRAGGCTASPPARYAAGRRASRRSPRSSAPAAGAQASGSMVLGWAPSVSVGRSCTTTARSALLGWQGSWQVAVPQATGASRCCWLSLQGAP